MNNITDFNRRIAEKITSFVSTMWCAYLFVALALISLPAAINSEDVITIVDWAAQTFLQLVLLSIIMVGQKKSSESVEQMITETHAAALAEFELAKEAREMARQELVELKVLTAEMHLAIKSSGSGK
jgi:DNA integrity scanning protein DisA with diadenylate cyclase activity